MAEKPQAQQLVDRLLVVRNALGTAAKQLNGALVTIRGRDPVTTAPETAPGAALVETRFFPAIEALVADIEAFTDRIAAAGLELERKF